MRGLTSVAVMGLVLAGLGAYIYFSQSSRSGAVREIRQKAIAIKQGDITELAITSSSGEVSTIARNGHSWQITSPIDAPADPTLMARLVTLIANLEVTRVVEEDPLDLGEFGLAPPQGELALTVGGGEALRILVGSKAPVGGAVYARLSSSPRVILVPGDLAEAANRSPIEFRHNGIFTLEQDRIDHIEITSSGRSVQLVKHGVDWELTTPLSARGDLGVVSDLLTKLTAMKMAGIIEAPAPSQSRVDKAVASITASAGESRETLRIGGRADSSNVYARNLSRPMVFTVPSSLVDELTTEPAHYRRKDVFDFQTIEATRLEVSREGRTIAYEKQTAPGSPGRWRALSADAREAEPAKIEAAMSQLSFLRALTFVPTPARLSDGPGVMSVTVNFDEGRKSESVVIAKAGSDAFAVRPDWPDAARLDANAYALLVASIDELQK